jgi:RNA polymerase sigma factor (sigma-70 family)
MAGINKTRAAWLAEHILPHEASLRLWLRAKRTLKMDIDDVVQEAYAILASVTEIEHIRNPKAYFYQTAYSVVLREWRHEKVISIRTVADMDSLQREADIPSQEDTYAGREALFHLNEAIRQLPNKCGQAFRLCKVEEKSQREAARLMKISESTLEKHVAKALFILMEKFGRKPNDNSGKGLSQVSKGQEINAGPYDDLGTQQRRDD